jgi:hypothetical protein
MSSNFSSVNTWRFCFCFLSIKSPVVLSLFTKLLIIRRELLHREIYVEIFADTFQKIRISHGWHTEIHAALKHTAPWSTTLRTNCNWEQVASDFLAISFQSPSTTISRTRPNSLPTTVLYSVSSESESYVTTDGQPASLPWNKAPIWGLRPDLYHLCDNYGLVLVGRPLWREVGSVFCICYWPLPAQSFSGPSPLGLETIFYCLRIETSLFVASYFLAGSRWRYSTPPPHWSRFVFCVLL